MPVPVQTILILASVISFGLWIGNLRLGGFKLGIAGVLFAGVVAGHLGAAIPTELLEFLRDFGLILFVYLVGLQVGPGFVAALRSSTGLLVPLSAAIVAVGTVLAALMPTLLGIPPYVALGILAGATTNTPSLAAAQDSLGTTAADMLAVGYAISYPGAVISIIAFISVTRRLFGVSLPDESAAYRALSEGVNRALVSWSIRVENSNIDGMTLTRIPLLQQLGVVVSRVECRDGVQLAKPETVIHLGDTVHVVGEVDALQQATVILGRRSSEDVSRKDSPLVVRVITLSAQKISGKTVGALHREKAAKIRVTRIRRGDVEFTATDDVVLLRGDQLRVVGEDTEIDTLARELGNAPRVLETFSFLPLFMGIAIGVAMGLYQFAVPGLPSAIKLGLAGGPLVTALVLSRFSHSRMFPTFVPYGASMALRELGMMLFLAGVGLKAGPKFFEILFSTQGLLWIVCGAAITVLPLALVIPFARSRLRFNFLLLAGLAAGSLTDPPALAFANSLDPESNASSVAYATVYPVAMILRILCIQLLALLIVH